MKMNTVGHAESRSSRVVMAAGLGVILIFAPLAAFPQQTGQSGDYAVQPWSGRSPVLARHGMVSSEQPLASRAAVEILRKGGSAVDAAIAAGAMMGVLVPAMNGLGGDAFAIVWDPETGKLYGYNGSGPVSAGTGTDEMREAVRAAYQRAGVEESEQIPLPGPLSVSVPGVVDTWFALHDKFGKLPMTEVLAPAIALADEGYPVTRVVAGDWKKGFDWLEGAGPLAGDLANFKATYQIDGHLPSPGEIFRNPDLARSLSIIAEGGRDAFYKGEMAHTIDGYLRRLGGKINYDDLANHHGEWVEPLSVNYRGYDIYELPPNGQGISVLEMMNMLSGFDLGKMGAGTADTLAAQIEAKRLAFADLAAYVADPAHYDAPMDELISNEYADARRKLIDTDRANPDIGPGDPRLHTSDTIGLQAADESGMMVSLIQSNYYEFGSGLVPDGLGFALQNRGALFSLHDGDANLYEPGKRPFHTIIPAFVMKDGKPWLSFTLEGGDMQPQGHVQILTNMIDFGMNVQEAGDHARWRHRGSATATGIPAQGVGVVDLEPGFDDSVLAELSHRGFEINAFGRIDADPFGGYQAIHRDGETGVYWGGSDKRQDGQSIGY